MFLENSLLFFESSFVPIFVMAFTYRTCDCKQQFSLQDGLDLCFSCRECTRSQPCDICLTWTQDEWSNFAPSLDDVTPDIPGADPSVSESRVLVGMHRAHMAGDTNTEISSVRFRCRQRSCSCSGRAGFKTNQRAGRKYQYLLWAGKKFHYFQRVGKNFWQWAPENT